MKAAMDKTETGMRVSVIIPTLNPGPQIGALIDALQQQTVRPDEILVVDSGSEDGAVDALRPRPEVSVVRIERAAFDHGGTRDMALRMCRGDVAVMMTQDAMPVNEQCLERLLELFQNPRVAAVGGRQIARPDARPFERAVRAYSYPEESRVWTAADVERLGVRAFLISDVLAAYRRDAALAVGGFDHPVVTNEDMLMAERLLHGGYALAYSGRAAVYHSHRFTLRQEYERNYRIGRVMERYACRFCGVKEMGEGVSLAKSVWARLVRERHYAECAAFAASCAARLAGNRMGRLAERRALLKDGGASLDTF